MKQSIIKYWVNHRKIIQNMAPYLVIVIIFFSYIHYWMQIVSSCLETICLRGGDAPYYYNYFLGLLNGSWPGGQVFSQSPLYPYYLWLIHIVFQSSPNSEAIPYLVQIFLTILTGAMTYVIAKKMFSRSVALVAVLLLGLYEPIKFYITAFGTGIPLAFLLTATIYFLVLYNDNRNRFFLIIGSVCLGVSLLGRQNNLVFIVVIALWFVLLKVPFKKLLIDLLFLCLFVLLITLPAIIHSSLAAGKFVPITNTGIVNISIGNLPISTGTYGPWGEESLEPSVDFIIEQPVDWLQLTLRKIRLFFSFPWSLAPLVVMPLYWLIPWTAFIIFFFYYFFKTFTPQRNLLHFSLLFYAASIVIVFVSDNFRIPIVPIISIFVSVMLFGLLEQLNKGYVKVCQWNIKKPVLVVIWSLFVVIIILLQIPDTEISQKNEIIESEAVYGGLIVGQRFQADCPNLHQIAVKMFSNNPNGSIVFHLREHSIAGPEIFSQEIETSQLNSFVYHVFSFPEIINSSGVQYFFYFDTSNLRSAEEGIIFSGAQHPFSEILNKTGITKRIPGGVFINQEGWYLDGDLAFAAYCKANIKQLIKTTIDRLAQKTSVPGIVKILIPFFFVTHLIALLVGTVFILKRVFTRNEH